MGQQFVFLIQRGLTVSKQPSEIAYFRVQSFRSGIILNCLLSKRVELLLKGLRIQDRDI